MDNAPFSVWDRDKGGGPGGGLVLMPSELMDIDRFITRSMFVDRDGGVIFFTRHVTITFIDLTWHSPTYEGILQR